MFHGIAKEKHDIGEVVNHLANFMFFSLSAVEHIDHVENLLTILRDGGAKLKLKYWNHLPKTIHYSAFVTRPKCLQIALQTTYVITGIEVSRTVNKLKLSVDLCNDCNCINCNEIECQK